MVVVLDSDSGVGMVGGLLTNLDGSEQGGVRCPLRGARFFRTLQLGSSEKSWPRCCAAEYDFPC